MPQEKSASRLRNIVRFAVGLLLFLYVFRVPLLSPLLCLGLETSRRLTGIEVHIKRIAGSCVYDFSAEGIYIANKSGLKIKVKRLSLKYDPLALLWGERVAKKVEVIRPSIIVPTPGIEKKKTHTSKLPDIARILEQTPDLRIVQACILYRQKGKSVLVSGLDLENSISRQGKQIISQGRVIVRRVRVQGIDLPTINASWRLSCMRKKPIVVENANFNLGEHCISLKGNVALGDVGKTNLRGVFSIPSLKDALSLPLPLDGEFHGDFSLCGNLPLSRPLDIALAAKGYLQNATWQNKPLPTLGFSGDCRVDDTSLDISHFQLSLDKCNIWSLGGKLGYRPKTKATLQSQITLDSRQIEQILTTFSPSTFPDFPMLRARIDMGLEGKLPLGQKMSLDSNIEVLLNGIKWHDKPIAPITLTGSCHASDTLLLHFQLKLGDREICRLDGKIGYMPGEKIDISVTVGIKKMEEFLRSLKPLDLKLKLPLAGDLKGDIRVTGKVPTGRALALETSGNIALENFKWQKFAFPRIEIACDCKISDTMAKIAQMSLRWDKSEICQLKGQMGYDGEIELESSLHIEKIEKPLAIFLDSPAGGEVSAFVKIKGILSQKPLNLAAYASLKASNLSWRGEKLPCIVLDGNCKLKGNEAQVSSIRISLDEQEICNASGTFDENKIDLTGQFNLKQMDKLANSLQSESRLALPWTANLSGKVHANGLLDPVDIAVNADISASQLSWQENALPDISFFADCELNDKTLSVLQMKLGLGKRKIFHASGSLGYVPGSLTKMNLGFSLEKIEELGKLFGQDIALAGNVYADVTIEGKLPCKQPMELESTIALKAPGLIWQKTHLPALSLDSRFDVNDKRVKLEYAWLKLGKRRLSAVKGEIGYRFGTLNLAAALELGKIEELAASFGVNLPLSAKVSADFKVEGKLPMGQQMALTSMASIRASQIHWRGAKFPKITIDSRCELDDKRVTIKHIGLKLNESEVLNLKGEIGYLKKKTVRLKSTLKIENVEKLLALVMKDPPLKGNIEGKLAVQGQLPLSSKFNLQAESSLMLKDGILPPLRCKSLGIFSKFSLNQHTLFIDRLALDWAEKSAEDALTIVAIKGFIGYRGRHRSDIHVQIPVAAFANHFLPMLGRESGWQGKAPLQFSLTGQLPLDGEKIDIETRVNWPWIVSDNDNFWKLELGKLSFWGEKNKGKSGAFLLAKISGSLMRPSILAQAGIAQQKIRMGPVKVKNFSGEIIADDDALIVYSKLNMGSGILTVHGQIDYDNFMPRNIKILIEGKRLLLMETDEIYARADMRIVFSGKMRKTSLKKPKFKGSLKGSINVSEIEVNQSISLDSSPKRVFSYPNFDNPLLDLDLDINIRLDKIAIEAPGANLVLRGDILLGGKASRPAIKGKIETTEGKITVFQEPMNITHCMVSLREEDLLKPYLDIVAETTRGDYRVIVKIKSPPDPPLIEFSSIPPLSQEAALTLFLTGMTPEELQGENAGKKGVEMLSNMALQQLFNFLGIASSVSARFSDHSGNISVDLGKGFGMEGEVDKDGRASLQATYHFRFKMKDLFGASLSENNY